MIHTPAPTVVLVSASPRRKHLLQQALEVPLVCPSHAPEDAWAKDPAEQAQAIARQKLDALPEGWVQEVGQKVAALPHLAADSVVVLQHEVLGKPVDAAHARAMLASLSGQEHQVITGLIVRMGAYEHVTQVTTRVIFRRLSAAQIDAYIATGEPFDKAGGYGIQGFGGALVHEVHGSYTNVVGLPLPQTLHILAAARGAQGA